MRPELSHGVLRILERQIIKLESEDIQMEGWSCFRLLVAVSVTPSIEAEKEAKSTFRD